MDDVFSWMMYLADKQSHINGKIYTFDMAENLTHVFSRRLYFLVSFYILFPFSIYFN